MQEYFLKLNGDTYSIRRRERGLNEDFTYTESGNDITLTKYVGTERDVSIEKTKQYHFCFALPSLYKLNTDDYNYTFNNGIAILTKYIGSDTEIDTPILEEY